MINPNLEPMMRRPESERPIDGAINAKIMIVGDCPDQWAFKAGKPFAHAQETVLVSAMHHAGLMKIECCLTNLIYDSPFIHSYWRQKGHKGSSQLLKPIKKYQELLATYIAWHRPDVILAVGELTSYALLGRSAITKIRGYPYRTSKMDLVVIPTLHPRDMIWQNYEWRYYLAHDFQKAKRIVDNPKLITEERHIFIPQSFNNCMDLLTDILRYPRLSFDIEVSNYEISCIGYSGEKTIGYSIPLDDRWTEEEEVEIWKVIAGIQQNKSIEKVAQNGIFDVQFLASKLGIFTNPLNGLGFHDAMVKHHIMYPDFLKGLNFLGSIHSHQPYWKDELIDKAIKKES